MGTRPILRCIHLRCCLMENRSVPACTVIPVLIYEDVERACAWLCAAFGFTQRLRAGNGHAQLTVGDGAVFLSARRVGQGFVEPDEAEFWPPAGNVFHSTVHVRVEDVDGHCERARAKGAHFAVACRARFRRTAIHGRGLGRASLDVFAIDCRYRSGGLGRNGGATVNGGRIRPTRRNAAR